MSKKRNITAFDIQWKKRPKDILGTKKDANYWFQLGKKLAQSELQRAWDKKKSVEVGDG